MFQLSFDLQFCSCMNLIAATRAEGGLVFVKLQSLKTLRNVTAIFIY